MRSFVVDGIRRGPGRPGRPARAAGGVAALCCAAALLAGGCSSTVAGQAYPAAGGGGDAHPAPPTAAAPGTTTAPATPSTTAPSAPPQATTSVPGAQPGALDRLLPQPAAFPAGFADSAAVLSHHNAVSASEDLSGEQRGARTRPVQCAPGSQPPGPDDLAVITSTNAADNTTIAVQLERVPTDLTEFESRIDGCTKVQSNRFGAESKITRSLLDVPDVADHHVVAYEQKVRSGAGEPSIEQRSTTLAAQVDDVRIFVVGMNQHGRPPAAEDLSDLLAEAIDSVRAD
ncbi:hypothetical protein [Tomitella fengzijianii]|uniref:DUF5642 domain-containing protein n=1 Tax=Tomitella fengzijianii TaxID=2597660 RepID=A0A516X3H1_9ACTN|nr:hypothetical protein [Tomitella fengzijianii]QDQ97616.1 hypothetical protein FO059_10130 [Tomitella fengzijianii]